MKSSYRKIIKILIISSVVVLGVYFFSLASNILISKQYIFQLIIFPSFLFFCYQLQKTRRYAEIEIALIPFFIYFVFLSIITYLRKSSGSFFPSGLWCFIAFTFLINKDIMANKYKISLLLVGVGVIPVLHDIVKHIALYFDYNLILIRDINFMLGDKTIILPLSLVLITFAIYLIFNKKYLFITIPALIVYSVSIVFFINILSVFIVCIVLFIWLMSFSSCCKQSKSAFLVSLILFILILGFSVFYFSYEKKFTKQVFKQHLEKKYSVVKVGVDLLKKEIILGHGPKGVSRLFIYSQAKLLKKNRIKIENWTNPEYLNNVWLDVSINTGLLGLFIFFIFILLIFRRLILLIKNNKKETIYHVVFSAFLFIFLFSFIYNWMRNVIALIFFSFIMFFPSQTEDKVKFKYWLMVIPMFITLYLFFNSTFIFISDAIIKKGFKEINKFPFKQKYVKRHFDLAIYFNSDDYRNYYGLGEYYKKNNDNKKALTSFKLAFAKRPEKYFLVNIGMLEFKLNKFSEAEKSFKLLLSLYPPDEKVLFKISNMYYKTKKYSKALEYAEYCIKANPGNKKILKLIKKIKENSIYRKWINKFLGL